MIKIGVRPNLIYPVMIITFIGLRKIVEFLIKYNSENTGKYLLPLLIFISKFIAGLIAMHLSKYIIKSNSRKTIIGFKLLHSKIKAPQADSNLKIIVLIAFASYFDIIGTMIRKYFNSAISSKKFLDQESFKSFQIIASALLCYFTIRIKIYRHNWFCLIIISICLVIIIIIEMKEISLNDPTKSFTTILITIISCFGRAFLDTIEKYLFEFDDFNPFKAMMFEGLINAILIICLDFFETNSLKEGLSISLKSISLAPLIILLILYFILSALKNIYRVATIKLYSPMTRALAESFLDPIIIISSWIIEYNNPDNDKDGFFWFYYGINIFLSIIMTFCSCVYNEFIVLYCCGLEYNTYHEVSKRCFSKEENLFLLEENSSSSDEEEDSELKVSINDNNNTNN